MTPDDIRDLLIQPKTSRLDSLPPSMGHWVEILYLDTVLRGVERRQQTLRGRSLFASEAVHLIKLLSRRRT